MIYAINKRTKEHRVVPLDDRIGSWMPEWETVGADADGWIEWSGEECPLPYDSWCDAETIAMNYQRVLAKTLQWGKVTRYRPILSEPSETEATEWDGEGVPPVGCECELLRGKEWVPVEITGKGKRVTVFRRLCNHGLEEITEADATEFRPIRTAAQRAEEKAVEEMLSLDCEPREGMLSRSDFCRAIYRARYRKT